MVVGERGALVIRPGDGARFALGSIVAEGDSLTNGVGDGVQLASVLALARRVGIIG